MLTALVYISLYLYGLGRALAGKPLWGIFLYFMCFYAHAPTQWWGAYLPNLRWSLIASLVTLVAVLIHPPKEGFKFFAYRENRWLTAFFVYLLIQYPFVYSTAWHTDFVFLFLKFLVFIFLFQNCVRTPKDFRAVVIANALGGAFLAYQGFAHHNGGRLEGIGTPGMDDANLMGQHLVLLIFILGYAMLEPFRKVHILIAVCTCLVLMTLFLTESRGALISLALAGVVAAFFMPRGGKKKLMGFGVLGVIACALLMGPQIIERFQGVEKNSMGEVSDKSARSRIVIIESQIEMWKDSPIVGHGHRGTLLLSPQYIPSDYMSNIGLRASHNLVMSLLVDHGVIGLIFYFGAFVSCGLRIFSVNRDMVPNDKQLKTPDEAFLRAMIVGFSLALFSYFLGGLTSNNKKLEGDIWVFAFLPVAVHLLQRQKRQMATLVLRQKKQAQQAEQEREDKRDTTESGTAVITK